MSQLKSISTSHLLWSRYCSLHWDYNAEVEGKSYSQGAYILGKDNKHIYDEEMIEYLRDYEKKT